MLFLSAVGDGVFGVSFRSGGLEWVIYIFFGEFDVICKGIATLFVYK